MESTSFEDPFMQSVLDRIAGENHFKQPKYSISWASKPGENYCGRIYRAVITETNSSENGGSLSLIFKASPLGELRREFTSTDEIFRNEADVYEMILPTLNNILNKYGVVKSDLFPGTARCFGSFLENETKLIVLEDKSTEGFGRLAAKCKKRLDVDHCRLILEKLAIWHASFLALAQHEPEEAKQLEKYITRATLFGDVNGPILHEMKQSAELALAHLNEPFTKGSEMYKKVENLVQNYQQNLAAANEIPPDLSSIIHGDCWFNNFLFKYNKDGSLEDVCLVDLQLSRPASPVADLSYMMFVGTSKEVRDESYDELIRFYHSKVSSLLRKMNCDPEKIFPWNLLQEHLKKYSIFGILIALAGLRIMLLDSSECDLNLEVAEGDDNTVFLGRSKTTDPKKMEEISKRTTDVIVDAVRLGYLVL